MINGKDILYMNDKLVINIAILGTEFSIPLIKSQAIDENIIVSKGSAIFCLRKNKSEFETKYTDTNEMKFIEAKINANVYVYQTIENNIDDIIEKMDVIIYEMRNKSYRYNLSYVKCKVAEKNDKSFVFSKLFVIGYDESEYFSHIIELFYLSDRIYDRRAKILVCNQIVPQITKMVNDIKKETYTCDVSVVNKNIVLVFDYMTKLNKCTELILSPSYHCMVFDYICSLLFTIDYSFFNAKYILFVMLSQLSYEYSHLSVSKNYMSKYKNMYNSKSNLLIVAIIVHLFHGVPIENRYINILGSIITKFNLFTLANEIFTKKNMMYMINIVKQKKWKTTFLFDKLVYDNEYIDAYLSLK